MKTVTFSVRRNGEMVDVPVQLDVDNLPKLLLQDLESWVGEMNYAQRWSSRPPATDEQLTKDLNLHLNSRSLDRYEVQIRELNTFLWELKLEDFAAHQEKIEKDIQAVIERSLESTREYVQKYARECCERMRKKAEETQKG